LTVRDLLRKLCKGDIDKEILLSSDEEMNCLYSKFEISPVAGKPDTLVIWGYTGSEVDL